MKHIRFGIIGAGDQGLTYAGLLTGRSVRPGMTMPPAPEHAELAALCGRSQQTRERCAQLFPQVPFFTDYKQMVRSGAVDAVIVSVPHYQHPEVTAWCLEQGMPVLMEKPAGVDAKSVLALHRAADAHPDVPFGILYNHRANSLWRRVHALVASRELGEVRSSRWVYTSCYRPDAYYQAKPGRGTWGGEGGGVLANQASHQLDLWQWLCGVPTFVTAQMRFGAYRGSMAAENEAMLMTRYENGATGLFMASAVEPVGTDRLEICLEDGHILVENGQKATIHRYKASEILMNAMMGPEEADRLVTGQGLDLYGEEVWTGDEPWGVQHAALIENFALHMLRSDPLWAPGRQGLATVELVNAALLSAWQEKEQELPVDPEVFVQQLNQRIREEGLYPPRT